MIAAGSILVLAVVVTTASAQISFGVGYGSYGGGSFGTIGVGTGPYYGGPYYGTGYWPGYYPYGRSSVNVGVGYGAGYGYGPSPRPYGNCYYGYNPYASNTYVGVHGTYTHRQAQPQWNCYY